MCLANQNYIYFSVTTWRDQQSKNKKVGYETNETRVTRRKLILNDIILYLTFWKLGNRKKKKNHNTNLFYANTQSKDVQVAPFK